MRAISYRSWLVVALAIVTCLLTTAARAATPPSSRSGQIAVSIPGDAAGPLALVPGQGGWVGEFTITNVGASSLTVSRIAVRGDEDDVRSPSHLSVRFAEGSVTSATLPPGASRIVIVSWMPDKDPRVRQAFGHVIVTSTDEQAGEVAVGFHAQLPTGLGWVGDHTLSLLVVCPLVVVLLAGVSWLAGSRDPRIVRGASVAVAVTELLLALWMYRHFTAGVTRSDGNDGFQLVERTVWLRSIGAEWYVGVDGSSVALVLLAAIVGLAGVLTAHTELRTAAYYGALALLMSGIMGVLVALDLVQFFLAWQLVLLAMVMLVGAWGQRRSEHAAAKLAAYGAIGSAAMMVAFIALSRASGRSFLVDGAPIAHTMAIPELPRTSFAARGTLLGMPLAQVTWTLLFVCVCVATPLVPLHGWLADALEQGPASAAIVIGGIVVALGPYLLVRIGLGAVPEGARWAAASLAAIGAFATAWGALCAMAQNDLRRFVAYTTIATGGACLYGIGALTADGIAGALTALFAHGLAAAMLLGVGAALEQRVRTCDVMRVGGLARETPGLAALAMVGLAVSLGAPGLVGSWGVLVTVLGGFVRHPVLAVFVAVAIVISAAAHLRIARHLLLGELDAAWRRSRYLVPLGGRLPDATPRELIAFVPLAALSLLLGLWPAPLFAPIAASARELSVTLDPTAPDVSADAR